MRLVKDHSAGAYVVSVPCFKCAKMLSLSDAVMDLDGPAFQAYYHANCLIETVHCGGRDCGRCGPVDRYGI